jgi:hypothetical protein
MDKHSEVRVNCCILIKKRFKPQIDKVKFELHESEIK